MNTQMKLCDCGSGLPSEWKYDARGIELCRACDTCWEKKKLHYRKDVLEDPNYWAGEDKEED